MKNRLPVLGLIGVDVGIAVEFLDAVQRRVYHDIRRSPEWRSQQSRVKLK
jgi:hypothetical protein